MRCLRAIALLLALQPCTVAAGGLFDPGALKARLRRMARRMAEEHAPPRHDQAPPWAVRSDAPLATFALVSDTHYHDTGTPAWTRTTRGRVLKLVRFLNEHVRPQRTFLLGDLIAVEERSDQLRRVKALLDEHLVSPYHTLPGNHDGPGYDAVFGERNRSLQVAGLRVLTLGMTYWEWNSGLGWYDRLDWLARQLEAHREEPTLVLTHNPVCLPSFLNSGAVEKLLDAQPHVLGIIAGHVHVDYELRLGKVHLGMPMAARPPYGFKVAHLHPDALLLFTYEEQDGAYRRVGVYQKFDIPAKYRLGRGD